MRQNRRSWALPRRRKARCPTRRRPTMLRLLLALALAVPAAGQEPKSTATPVCATAAVSSPAGDNGCNYGACKSLTSGTLTCVYDESFCDAATEDYLTAKDVIDAGEVCMCMDILDYPSNIGTCSSSGVYSPMAVAGETLCRNLNFTAPSNHIASARTALNHWLVLHRRLQRRRRRLRRRHRRPLPDRRHGVRRCPVHGLRP